MLATSDIRELLRDGRTLRASELYAAGIRPIELTRLVARGALSRLARGLYALPDRSFSEIDDLVIVAKRVPNAVFCLLTALQFHELTTQAPFEVWIAISRKNRVPNLTYPPLRVVRYSDQFLEFGVETHTKAETVLRVTSVARTVVDCFKFRRLVGLDVALEALRDARQMRRASADDLWRLAKLNRMTNVMQPYLEAIG